MIFFGMKKMSEIVKSPFWNEVIRSLLTLLVIFIVWIVSQGYSRVQGDRAAILKNNADIATLQKEFSDLKASFETQQADHKDLTRMRFDLDALGQMPSTLKDLDARLHNLERRLWHLLRDPPPQPYHGSLDDPVKPAQQKMR